MNALLDDVSEVTRLVWSQIGGLDAVASGPNDDAALTVAGSVHIAGGWNGAVVVTMSAPLARTLTANMFGDDPDSVADEDVADAVGEIANQVGGNVKSLLPGPSDLSMPAVVAGAAPRFPGTEVVQRLHFVAGGEPFDVTVLAAIGTDTHETSTHETGTHETSTLATSTEDAR